jgi:hypothetical protein
VSKDCTEFDVLFFVQVNLVSLDTKGASELEQQFKADLKYSQQITLEAWTKRSIWKKIISWISYQLCRAVFA